jgi:glucokinase
MTLLGVDLGGTNTRVAAVSADGKLLAQRRVPTEPRRGPQATIGMLLELAGAVVDECSHAGGLQAVGIGVTGPVDVGTGVVDNPYTLAGWPPTDVAGPFRERFAVPVAVDNDANAAALGEWWRGAGRGVRRLAAITIGTGIGAAFLVDGQVQRRSDGRHGEAGHHVLDPHGPPCYCGARGCWETLASAPAIARMARRANPPAGSALHALVDGDLDAIDGSVVAAAAREHDPVALEVLATAARWIALGLVNTAAFFSADVVVLAGSASENLPLMRPTITEVLAQHRHAVPTDLPLRSAETGDHAGVLGAAYAALLGATGPAHRRSR